MKRYCSILICVLLLLSNLSTVVHADEAGGSGDINPYEDSAVADYDTTATETKTDGTVEAEEKVISEVIDTSDGFEEDTDNRIEEDTATDNSDFEEPSTDNTTELEPKAEIMAVNASLQTPYVVYDWDELAEWLDEQEDSCVTVALGADIEVIDNANISTGWGIESITIVTGEYGFFVKDCLSIGSNIHITGDGNPTPVIWVHDGGELYILDSDYTNAQTITVTGDGGIGLKMDNGASYDASNFCSMRYRAIGADSIAIKSNIALDLHEYHIEASGSGAMGIVSSKSVSMYLSTVTADGASICAADVELDTCSVTPDVPGAKITSRKISKIKWLTPYLFDAGSKNNGYFIHDPIRCAVTISAEDLEDDVITVWLAFDDSKVDFNTPGKYYMPPILPPPYDALNLMPSENPVTLAIDILDPCIPFLSDMMYYYFMSTYHIKHLYAGEEDITLWRSDNDGKNWYVYWKSGDDPNTNFEVISDAYSLNFYIYDESVIPVPAWFAYEVGKDKGSSLFYVDLAAIPRGNGGDRDGGDRQLPWEVFSGNTGAGNSGSDDDPQNSTNTNNNGNPRNNGGGSAAKLPDTRPANNNIPAASYLTTKYDTDGSGDANLFLFHNDGMELTAETIREPQDMINALDTIADDLQNGQDAASTEEPFGDLILEPQNLFSPPDLVANQPDSAVDTNKEIIEESNSSDSWNQVVSYVHRIWQNMLSDQSTGQKNIWSAFFTYLFTAAGVESHGVVTGFAYAFKAFFSK